MQNTGPSSGQPSHWQDVTPATESTSVSREDLEERLSESAPPLASPERLGGGAATVLLPVLTVIYVGFSVLNGLTLTAPVRGAVVSANVFTALLLAGLTLLARRFRRHEDALLALAFVLAVGNSVNGYVHLRDPQLDFYVVLAVIAFAALSSSVRWFAIGTAVMTIEWLVVLSTVTETPVPERRTLFLGASLAIAVVLFVVRYRLLRQARRALERAASSERVLRQFVQHTPAAVAMFDRGMRYVAVSNRWREAYRLGSRRLLGVSHYEVFPEIGEEWKEIHRHCLAGHRMRRAEDPFPREDGTLDWIRWDVQPWYDQDDEIGGLLMFTENITAEKGHRDFLVHRATIDSLTALPNRSSLEESLERFWRRRDDSEHEGFSVFFLDLDGFKEINDGLGHVAGDQTLVEVASRLGRMLRPGDLVGRWGGDEFLLVLPRLPREQWGPLVHRVERAVEVPIVTGAGTARVGVSVGCVHSAEADSIAELLEMADARMYSSKRG